MSIKIIQANTTQANEYASILTNKTCKRILDALAQKTQPVAEHDLVKALKLPASTIHYNMQKLKKADLIVATHFNYSDKGKQVNHYQLKHQYVIISPKQASLTEILQQIAPAFLIGLTVIIYSWFQSLRQESVAMIESVRTMADQVDAPMMAADVAVQSAQTSLEFSYIYGFFTALVIITLTLFVLRRFNRV
ncbi:MAG: helix-turn-helix domain-containing protein [Candidatus Woesearchaeota archaeon]